VFLARETVELRDVEPPRTRASQTGACVSAGRHGIVLAVGDECLTADPGFECGGRLQVWRDGKPTDMGNAQPTRFQPRTEDVLFFEKCGHGAESWNVDSLVRGPTGTWMRRRLAGTMGSKLLAFAARPDGAVDLLVQDPGSVFPPQPNPACLSRTRRQGIDVADGPYVVLRVGADGVVTALE
jgi:hypothetical protein